MRRVVKTPFPSDPLITDPAMLGAAIRAGRTAQGLTSEEAAMTIGIAKQTLTDIEAGKPTVGWGTVFKVANNLGVSLFLAPASDRERIKVLIRKAAK